MPNETELTCLTDPEAAVRICLAVYLKSHDYYPEHRTQKGTKQ